MSDPRLALEHALHEAGAAAGVRLSLSALGICAFDMDGVLVLLQCQPEGDQVLLAAELGRSVEQMAASDLTLVLLANARSMAESGHAVFAHPGTHRLFVGRAYPCADFNAQNVIDRASMAAGLAREFDQALGLGPSRTEPASRGLGRFEQPNR